MALTPGSGDAAARERLYRSLGRLPDRHRPIRSTVLSTSRHGDEERRDLLLDLNGEEPVRAWLVRPWGATGRIPAILYNHAHGGEYEIGRTELIEGREILSPPPYAQALCREGWAVLAIDHWCFGHRRQQEANLVKSLLWRGSCLWGMMVYDSLRALDFLVGLPDIDPTRIATLGMSMGSTMAWWMAALDPRIKVCIDLLCLTDYQAFIAADALREHGMYYFVPGLLESWTATMINALIAPRPHLAIAGTFDPLTPVDGLDRIESGLDAAYAAAGAPPGSWRLERHGTGHRETPGMRAQVMSFLGQWL